MLHNKKFFDFIKDDEISFEYTCMAEKNYITCIGIEKLREEYNELFHKERPALVQTIAWAASNGDRSENADYIYGKRRLREIDRRLEYLNRQIQNAEIVDVEKVQSENVVFGARVTLRNSEGNSIRVHIVGENETQPEKELISWRSPLARALLGKTVQDDVVVKKPNGDEIFTILKIEYQNYKE